MKVEDEISQEIYHLVTATCSVGDRAKLEHACHKVCCVYSKFAWKACWRMPKIAEKG